MSTDDPADGYDVPERAVTERVRRALDSLGERSLVAQNGAEEYWLAE